MRSLSRQRLGSLLILLAVVGVVGSLAVSAATTPDIGTDSTDNSTDRERTLVGMQRAGQVAMLDASDEVMWRTDGGENTNTFYFGVSMLENGTVLTAVALGHQQSCGPFEPPCGRTGFRLIDPQPTPHVVGGWTFPIRSRSHSEVHDVDRLPTGEFLVVDMEYERILTVAPNGTVTWQWNASRRYDAPPDSTQTDWLHLNDVDRISSGKYLVSVRNANQLLIIERGTGVVGVINEDEPGSSDEACRRQDDDLDDYNNDSGGDILCGDPELFDHQHNPQYLGPGTVLVADSENDRVVELHKTDGNWTVAWGVNSANGVGFDWPRDADRLPNGTTLITDTRNNRIVEVTQNGTAVWSAKTGIWPYEADRLPYGELPGDRVRRINATGDVSVSRGEAVLPLLGRAHAGLSYVVALPVWFQPWHIGVTAFAVLLACAGGILVWSGGEPDDGGRTVGR